MTDDYISKQILSIGSTVLGERLRAFSAVSHDKSLEITRDCNAVICCSFNEALPLSVVEGMSRGHIVLRNDAGGMEEQLDEGVNGFRIDGTDIRQFAGVLARVLDKRTMADSRLQTMGRASQELVNRLLIPSYVDALEPVRDATSVTDGQAGGDN
jgi:glycosyltransferase involved in cell wall biosynthesis